MARCWVMETAVKSERARKTKRIAKKAVAAFGESNEEA